MIQFLRVSFFVIICNSFTLANAQSLRKNYDPLPEDASFFLAKLPEGEFTLRLILQRGIASTDTYASIQTKLLEKDAPRLDSRSFLTSTIEITGNLSDDQSKSVSPFAPVSSRVGSLGLNYNRQLSSGTNISAGLSYGDNKTIFQSFADTIFKETEVSLTVSQSFWKNGFGRQSGYRLKSGESLSEAVSAEVDDATLSWMEDLTAIFYQAWLAQAQVRASADNVERKERLLRLTQLQQKRGTAERPDVLQVKQALLNSEIQHRDATDAVEVIWRDLVFSLKMPAHWIKIDPMKIPVGLDEPVSKAHQLCTKNELGENLEKESARIRTLRHRRDSAEQLYKAAKEGLKPDLSLTAGLTSNGVDVSESGSTVTDAFSVQNPAWAVGLSLEFSLDKYREKAELQRQASSVARLQAETRLATASIKSGWVDVCRSLESWIRKVERLEKSLQEQRQRVELEEKRFRLGRGVLNNVILAGDDMTSTETVLNSGRVSARKTAWDILRRSGRGKKYLAELKSELPLQTRAKQ